MALGLEGQKRRQELKRVSYSAELTRSRLATGAQFKHMQNSARNTVTCNNVYHTPHTSYHTKGVPSSLITDKDQRTSRAHQRTTRLTHPAYILNWPVKRAMYSKGAPPSRLMAQTQQSDFRVHRLSRLDNSDPVTVPKRPDSTVIIPNLMEASGALFGRGKNEKSKEKE